MGRVPVAALGAEVLRLAMNRSENPAVRVAAVEAAALVEAPGALEALAPILRDPETPVEVRTAIALATASLGSSPESVAALRAITESPVPAPPSFSSASVDLSQILAALHRDLDAGGDAQRPVSLAALPEVSPEHFVREVRSFERRFRVAAIRLAAVAGGEEVLPVIREFVDDPDPEVAAGAAIALGLRQPADTDLRDPAAAPAIVRALERWPDDASVQRLGAQALSMISDPSVLGDLIRLVETGKEVPRRHAVVGIGRTLSLRGHDGIAPALVESAEDTLGRALRDPDEGVRANAVAALGPLLRKKEASAERIASTLVPLVADPDENVRLAAATALVTAPTPLAADALRHRLELAAESPQVRAAGVRGLAALSDREALRVIVLKLEDPVVEVRSAARVALQKVGLADFGFAPEASVTVVQPVVDRVRRTLMARPPEPGDRAAALLQRIRERLSEGE